MTENPAQPRGLGRFRVRDFDTETWDNVGAQNGPGIAALERRPGPDLSASLDTTEEH
jgi:hypothetical protein